MGSQSRAYTPRMETKRSPETARREVAESVEQYLVALLEAERPEIATAADEWLKEWRVLSSRLLAAHELREVQ